MHESTPDFTRASGEVALPRPGHRTFATAKGLLMTIVRVHATQIGYGLGVALMAGLLVLGVRALVARLFDPLFPISIGLGPVAMDFGQVTMLLGFAFTAGALTYAAVEDEQYRRWLVGVAWAATTIGFVLGLALWANP